MFDASIITQIGSLLAVLAVVAESVQMLIEQLKPIVIDEFAQQHEDLYIPTIFVLRFLLSLLGVLVIGGADFVTAQAPVFVNVADWGLVFLATMLVVGGADLLHALHDFVYGIRDKVQPEIPEDELNTILTGNSPEPDAAG